MTFKDTEVDHRCARRSGIPPIGYRCGRSLRRFGRRSGRLYIDQAPQAVAAQTSAPASSALASSPGPAFSSVPITAFPASPLASADPSLASPVSSEVPGASLIANIQAPATKGGFQIRLHRGSILQVTVPQAKAGTPVTFTLVPATSTSLTPIAGHDGYFNGAQDGVVNVTVTQGGAAIGTLSVTVWG